MTPALCPVCRGELVIGGDDLEGTHYHWCPFCDEARDPVAATVAEERGEGNMRTNRRFGEDRTKHGARESDR